MGNEHFDTGDETLNNKIQKWLEWDRNKVTMLEVQELIRENNLKKLSKLFLNRLEFGTAGFRARMGAGFCQMNDLVVIQSAQGIVQYLLKVFNDARERGFVIGYDGRYNSRRFAELTAAIFLNKGFKVYLYSDVCPTPFVPFAITHYDCVAGVVVTASHNPKEDNGYKVYWQNGAQIISPHDKDIQKTILDNLEPWEKSWDVSIVLESGKNDLLIDPLADVMTSYYKKLQGVVFYPELNSTSDVKIAYSAMHGVGYKYVVEAFKVGNLGGFVTVIEQRDPDPEFPTVKFPNPEEGKSALNLSIKTAEENGCTIILANDPDADRLAVAEKSADGEWKVFSGNELGALLGWWSLFCYKLKNPQASDLSNVYMLSSTVSSKILATMAQIEKFKFEETLTGFKWMGNVSYDLIKSGKEVLFAFEEAIGFMCGNGVLDKDGVSAAVVVAEMAGFLRREHGTTLADKLKEIYSVYGHHITLNSYYVCHEPKIIKEMFHRLRNYQEQSDRSYPRSILKGKYPITGVRDLTTDYDTCYDDKKARLPVSKSSQMITFKFENGLVATLRTSGTEPKIKYYTELCADVSEQNVTKLQATLQEMVDALVEEFLEPTKNGLIPRSD